MPPLVSCLLSTCDREAWVKLVALPCFLNQTHRRIELIVIDDGKPPLDSQVLEQNPRVKHVKLRDKTPQGVKFNIAMQLAQGDYLAFWADDDWQHPTRIATQLADLTAVAGDVNGLDNVPYIDLRNRLRYIFKAPKGQHLLDGTLLFSRRYANLSPFPRSNENLAFWFADKPNEYAVPHNPRKPLYMGAIHGNNMVLAGYPMEELFKPDPRPYPTPTCLLGAYSQHTPPSIKETIFKVDRTTEDESLPMVVSKLLNGPAGLHDFSRGPFFVVFDNEFWQVLNIYGDLKKGGPGIPL